MPPDDDGAERLFARIQVGLQLPDRIPDGVIRCHQRCLQRRYALRERRILLLQRVDIRLKQRVRRGVCPFDFLKRSLECGDIRRISADQSFQPRDCILKVLPHRADLLRILC